MMKNRKKWSERKRMKKEKIENLKNMYRYEANESKNSIRRKWMFLYVFFSRSINEGHALSESRFSIDTMNENWIPNLFK